MASDRSLSMSFTNSGKSWADSSFQFSFNRLKMRCYALSRRYDRCSSVFGLSLVTCGLVNRSGACGCRAKGDERVSVLGWNACSRSPPVRKLLGLPSGARESDSRFCRPTWFALTLICDFPSLTAERPETCPRCSCLPARRRYRQTQEPAKRDRLSSLPAGIGAGYGVGCLAL
jgi:hypothetical protein